MSPFNEHFIDEGTPKLRCEEQLGVVQSVKKKSVLGCMPKDQLPEKE